ncbi:MAG: AIR synthase-related protein, partial [Myxococcota bacterium]
AEVEVRAMAHITGGGLPGNVARSLPGGAAVQIDASAWRRPPIFDLLAGAGIPAAEQYRAFNMGVGMTVIVHSSQANQAMEVLRAGGEEALVIGEVVDRGEGPAVRLHGIDAEGELS